MLYVVKCNLEIQKIGHSYSSEEQNIRDTVKRDDQDTDECSSKQATPTGATTSVCPCSKVFFCLIYIWLKLMRDKPGSDLLPSGFRCLSREECPSTMQESFIYLARPQKDLPKPEIALENVSAAPRTTDRNENCPRLKNENKKQGAER